MTCEDEIGVASPRKIIARRRSGSGDDSTSSDDINFLKEV
jgi:hypothetical protein